MIAPGCGCEVRDAAVTGRFKTALWIALAINGAMFAAELAAALIGRSVALQADSLDFLGDAANYGIALLVAGMHIRWRSRAALLKGLSMGLFGLWVVATTVERALAGAAPVAEIMGGMGVVALAANVFCAVLLYRFREGDANMRSVWVCSRNDALANLAVIAAAAGVWGTGTAWPDLVVGFGIAALALWSSVDIVGRAVRELRDNGAAPAAPGE